MRQRLKIVRALQKLVPDLSLTSIVDVGANPTEKPPYRMLMRAGQARVYGFEPDPRAFAKLEQSPEENVTYLNKAVGDGARHTLHVCKGSYMSSLLRPDPLAIELFPQMGRSLEVIQTLEMETAALDHIDEIERIDLLKIDIQGGELQVFQNARTKLDKAVCIQSEVSFFPIYENQPGFGEIDVALRGLGLLPHSLPVMHRNPVSPLRARRRYGNQLCDGDIVYLRDIRHLDRMDVHQLCQLAVIAVGYLDAQDICARALEELCRRGVVAEKAMGRFFQEFPAENGEYAFEAANDPD
ncbi:MAG: FkbM family methyltransferase [Sulfitobacter sp.]|nr:FkbM family methyltransferase [Sulfitobacter sp.]